MGAAQSWTVSTAPVRISLFEVPPEDDDAFVAARRRAPGALLLRALREDVGFRFVEIGGEAPVAGTEGRWPEHAGGYEVVHEDGLPDGDEGVILVGAFEVPPGEDERFMAAWHAARDALAGHRGYQGTRLHRSAEAELRFVDVARWSSPLALARATRDPALGEPGVAMPFDSQRALYLSVGG